MVAYTWTNGNGTGIWAENGNWNAAGWPVNDLDSATFNNTSVANCNITGALDIGALTLAANYTGTLAITAANFLGVTAFTQNGGTFNGGTGTMETVGPVSFGGGTYIEPTGNHTVSGNLTATGNFTYTLSAGKMILNGVNQTITGFTSFSRALGNLELQTSAILLTDTHLNYIEVAQGAVLTQGAHTIQIAGDMDIGGRIDRSTGTIDANGGDVTFTHGTRQVLPLLMQDAVVRGDFHEDDVENLGGCDVGIGYSY